MPAISELQSELIIGALSEDSVGLNEDKDGEREAGL